MLRETQARFADALLGRDSTAAELIRAGALTPARRLEIYRHNVMTNLRGALRDIYPVVERIVGEAFFQHAADRFIAETPSRSGDLNRFGAEWPDFLSTYPHAVELPYLSDVARLEWVWHECFHAADADALDLARLADVPPDDHAGLRFRLHPAVRLVASAYPLLRIWEVNQPGYGDDVAIDWDAGGDSLLVRRDGNDIAIEALPHGAFRFLSALSCGAAMEPAAEAALAVDAEFDLQGFLLESVQSAVIVDFERGTP
ncbi:MAG: putative DNA-binding domain-containing protein [Betaproteobacteria bacterium]|nr:putative DNA-binding domain-containing protein [Betaproteobacteria bacterium]